MNTSNNRPQIRELRRGGDTPIMHYALRGGLRARRSQGQLLLGDFCVPLVTHAMLLIQSWYLGHY